MHDASRASGAEGAQERPRGPPPRDEAPSTSSEAAVARSLTSASPSSGPASPLGQESGSAYATASSGGSTEALGGSRGRSGSRHSRASSAGAPHHSRVPSGEVKEAVIEGEGGQLSVLRWQQGELLGRGAFGAVYLGLNLDSGELIAVKQVEVAMGGAGSAGSSGKLPAAVASRLREVEGEVALLRRLQHPSIVRYIGAETDEARGVLSIFLEYVPGGSIAQLLTRFGSFHERVVRAYTRQILKGLAYLHAMDVVHRDIKGANLLVDNGGFVKVCSAVFSCFVFPRAPALFFLSFAWSPCLACSLSPGLFIFVLVFPWSQLGKHKHVYNRAQQVAQLAFSPS